jgi:hypothetical protein
MHLKVERYNENRNVISGSRVLINSEYAGIQQRNSFFSIIKTALKYPFHLVTRAIEETVKVVGKVATMPLHAIAFPLNFVFAHNSPYTGKTVNELGDKLSDFLATGVRMIDTGINHKLHFGLDHFTGCRFGLFNFATKQPGGKAIFNDFEYEA